MRRHKTILTHVKKLNSFINSIRKSVQLTKIFANEKCRLRLENLTRWGSTFLMLERIYKAYKKGLFSNIKLPVSIKIINTYLNILKHPYLFNTSLQRNTCSISEVIPTILKVISQIKKISTKTTESGKRLCEFLIDEFKIRFKFEFNSDMYKVIIKTSYKYLKLNNLS